MLKLVVLSGPSGSGNTTARYAFEELNFNIVENVPVESLPAVIEVLKKNYSKRNHCLIVPALALAETLKICKADKDILLKSIVLTCTVSELNKRYALTKHAHPLTVGNKMSLEKAMKLEIETVGKLKDDVDVFLDTSELTPKVLRSTLHYVTTGEKGTHFTVKFLSFGIKNGTPLDLDMMIDVRTLPNPFWEKALKDLTGLDKDVIAYLESFPETKEMLDKLIHYLEYVLPKIEATGRALYTIGICCSGGQHRSPYIAHQLGKHFKDQYKVISEHRDIDRLDTRVKE